MENRNEEMHRLLSGSMLDILRNGREVLGPDGNVIRVQPTAADFNAIRGFLKDQGVTAIRTKDSPLNDLVAEMAKRGRSVTARDIAGDADDHEG